MITYSTGRTSLTPDPNHVLADADLLLNKRVSELAVQASWNLAAGASVTASLACVPTWHEDFPK